MGLKDAMGSARARGDNFLERFRGVSPDEGGGVSAGGVVGSSQSSNGIAMNGLSKSRADAAEQYKHNTGWVFSSIRIIAQRIARQPIRVARYKRMENSRSIVDLIRQPRKDTLPGSLKEAQAELELLDGHDLIDTINDPNPIMVRWSLMYVTVASLELTGKAFWWIKEGEPGSGRKWEIWHVPTDWVSAKHDNDKLFTSWVIRPPGSMEGVEVNADDLAYFYYPDPSNPLGALSPLQAQARSVVADEFIVEAQRRGFMNSIWPGHAIIIGRTQSDGTGTSNLGGTKRAVLTKQQRQTILSAFLNAYRGVYRSDEPVILDGLIEDIKKITNNNREMDFLNSSKLTKGRITQGFGVNPISMGEIENANRASAQVADEHLCNNTINPKIELISQCLTAWVCPVFESSGGSGLVAYIEEAQSTDPEMDLKRAEAGVRAQAMTINEFRHHVLRLGPVHGGDVVMMNGTLRPMRLVSTEDPAPNGPAYLPGEEEGSEDDGEQEDEEEEGDGEQEDEEKSEPPPVEPEDILVAGWKLGQPLQGRYWSFGSKLASDSMVALIGKSVSRQEVLVEDTMKVFFRSYFSDVVKKAQKLADGNQIHAGDQVANLVEPREFTAKLKDALYLSFRPVVASGVATEWWLHAPRTRQQVARWSPSIDAGIRRYKSSDKNPPDAACDAEPLPVGGVNSILTEMPDDIKDEIDSFTTGLTSQPYWGDQAPAVRLKIAETINASLKAGDSNQEMIAKLNATLGGEANARAALIARTETTGALNAGQDMTRNKLAAQGLISGKEWNASLDPNTRGDHVRAHGQKVRPGEFFKIGGEQGRYPGDTYLSPKQRCNCRCVAISVPIVEDPALLGAAATDKAIARALMINEAQAAGMIGVGADAAKQLLNLPSVEEGKIRSFVGGILKKVKGSTPAKRMGSFIKAVKGKIKCSSVYRAFNWWWNSSDMSARLTRMPLTAPVNLYLAAINKLVQWSGAGLPAGIQQGGYWTGIIVSYILTPYMPWLALPGASDAFAMAGLLGMQVGYRTYLATRWLGRKLAQSALGQVVKGGLNVMAKQGAVAVAENIDKAFVRLAEAGKPAAGTLEEWKALLEQGARLAPGGGG